MEPEKKRATYDDLLALPEGVKGEITSVSNAGNDRVTKRELYARYRVAHYWIADPAARTLETLRLDPATRRWVDSGAFDATSVGRIPPFEAIELDLSRVFPPPPPEP